MDFNNAASIRGFVKAAQQAGVSATEIIQVLEKQAGGNGNAGLSSLFRSAMSSPAGNAVKKFAPAAGVGIAGTGLGSVAANKFLEGKLNAVQAREAASHANHVQAAADTKANSLSFDNIKNLLLETAMEHPYLTGAGLGASVLGSGMLANHFLSSDDEEEAGAAHQPQGVAQSSQPV